MGRINHNTAIHAFELNRLGPPGRGGGGLLGLIFARYVPLDCLQSAFSLKICLVLDLIQHDCKPLCYYIGIESRREKMDC